MAKIPVIVVLPKQEPLLESATLGLQGRRSLDVAHLRHVPQGVKLSETQAAVSAGTALGTPMTLESMRHQASEVYAVRGEIEADQVANFAGPQAGGAQVFADPQIEPFPTCGGTPALGSGVDVFSKLNIAKLHTSGLDGRNVAVAIMDTGFNLTFLRKTYPNLRFDAGNSWTNPSAPGVTPGNQLAGPGISVSHGTMCAWNVLNIAPKATLLDYPILAGSPQAGAIIAASVMSAFLAYSHLAAKWAIGFGSGQAGVVYRGLVINNSWGMYDQQWDFPVGHPGRYSDNPNHIFNRLVASLAANGADIVFAAGNCGSACPDGRCGGTSHSICGANATQDVLTLGGCDTNDDWVGYSSQGPSIPKMHQQKPDLAAYTHFKGSEVYGLGAPDTGTSTSCPVAAGCIAALRSALDPRAVTPPASMIQQLISTATRRPSVASGGWNTDYGHGIINPVSAAASLGIIQLP